MFNNNTTDVVCSQYRIKNGVGFDIQKFIKDRTTSKEYKAIPEIYWNFVIPIFNLYKKNIKIIDGLEYAGIDTSYINDKSEKITNNLPNVNENNIPTKYDKIVDKFVAKIETIYFKNKIDSNTNILKFKRLVSYFLNQKISSNLIINDPSSHKKHSSGEVYVKDSLMKIDISKYIEAICLVIVGHHGRKLSYLRDRQEVCLYQTSILKITNNTINLLSSK